MWDKYYSVATIDDALDLLEREQTNAKIIAGGTDLILEMKQGLHPQVTSLIDINRMQDMDKIWMDKSDKIHIRAGVTHNQCISSNIIRKFAFPLIQACYGVGTPQIRNVATIVGNLATGSPANDTIVPLLAMNAELVLKSKSRERVISLAEFYKGVRSTVIQPNELITEVIMPKLKNDQKGVFKRYILRATHSISVVNVCIVLTKKIKMVEDALIVIGCVAPSAIRASEAELFLKGKELSSEVIEKTSSLALMSIKPISDVRATDQYRTRLVKLLITNALDDINNDLVNTDFPENPVLLWGKGKHEAGKLTASIIHSKNV